MLEPFGTRDFGVGTAGVWCLLALAGSAGCSSDRPAADGDRSGENRERTEPSASNKLGASTKPDASGAPAAVGPDGCTGREIHDCARTKGCLLDQPTYQTPLCRPAENPCEATVRHADLIGRDADPSVTPEMMKAAEQACLTISMCGVSSGRCSCSCAILANCDCSCGGSYLRRCTFTRELARFDGRPASDLGKGPIGEIGRALVAVARAQSGRAFKVDPLPAVGDLVGKTKHEIETVLGSGNTCSDTTTAPCKAVGQVFYSLYKLDKGALGGGPELLLSYDSGSKCSEAKITFTR